MCCFASRQKKSPEKACRLCHFASSIDNLRRLSHDRKMLLYGKLPKTGEKFNYINRFPPEDGGKLAKKLFTAYFLI